MENGEEKNKSIKNPRLVRTCGNCELYPYSNGKGFCREQVKHGHGGEHVQDIASTMIYNLNTWTDDLPWR